MRHALDLARYARLLKSRETVEIRLEELEDQLLQFAQTEIIGSGFIVGDPTYNIVHSHEQGTRYLQISWPDDAYVSIAAHPQGDGWIWCSNQSNWKVAEVSPTAAFACAVGGALVTA